MADNPDIRTLPQCGPSWSNCYGWQSRFSVVAGPGFEPTSRFSEKDDYGGLAPPLPFAHLASVLGA